MKFNHEGVIVDAFRYQIDPTPMWFNVCVAEGFIEVREDDCVITNTDFPMVAKKWDYIAHESNGTCYAMDSATFERTAYPIYIENNSMSEMDYYWSDKSYRKNVAYKHVSKMYDEYMSEIKESIKHSTIYRNQQISEFRTDSHYETEYKMFLYNTVDTLFLLDKLLSTNEKICILNFASFKNPGGAFLKGSIAQEESLCHSSTLYNVLYYFMEEFYVPNMKKLNHALYTHDMVYTPDIVFHNNDYTKTRNVDVITCAAPNRKVVEKYNDYINTAQINQVLKERIDRILYTAAINKDEVLILGPFGCGVFGNDPETVALYIRELIDTKYKNVFKTVVFSLPISNPNTSNVLAFWKVFSK